MRESGNQLENVVLQVLLPQVPIPDRIVKTDLNPSLEQVHLPNDRMEESNDVDSPVLVPIELQKRRRAEEMSALNNTISKRDLAIP